MDANIEKRAARKIALDLLDDENSLLKKKLKLVQDELNLYKANNEKSYKSYLREKKRKRDVKRLRSDLLRQKVKLNRKEERRMIFAKSNILEAEETVSVAIEHHEKFSLTINKVFGIVKEQNIKSSQYDSTDIEFSIKSMLAETERRHNHNLELARAKEYISDLELSLKSKNDEIKKLYEFFSAEIEVNKDILHELSNKISSSEVQVAAESSALQISECKLKEIYDGIKAVSNDMENLKQKENDNSTKILELEKSVEKTRENCEKAQVGVFLMRKFLLKYQCDNKEQLVI